MQQPGPDRMSDRFRLTLAQLNPTLGAPETPHWPATPGTRAKADGADMVALPEMFLSGYQTQDLVQRPAFLADLRATLDGWRATAPTDP